MRNLEALKRAHTKGKLAHAYLVSGNDEQGKEELIDKFVSFLLGPHKETDVALISPEKEEIIIGQIRKLKERLSYSSWNGLCKIGIIRQAERMNQEAQSALLKLLEEPAGNILLFLEARHAARLFDTIRSRTQELRMYAFSERAEEGGGLLGKLQNASLAERFAFAEKIAAEPGVLQETLQKLQQEARLQLLQEIQEGRTELLGFMRRLQEILLFLQQTQVNGKLAAQRLFLEL